MTPTSPADAPGRPRRAARLAGAAVRVAGWGSFGAIVLGLAIEHHPGLERWVARAAQERIGGALADVVTVADVDVLWLQRSVRLEGVAMGPSGEELRADALVVRLGLGGDGRPRVERVTVEGGSLTLCEALADPVGTHGTEGPGRAPLEILAESPEVVVRDFEVRLASELGRPAALGTVDLAMARGGEGGTRIFGRFVPTVGVAQEPAGVVWLEGSLEEGRTIAMRGVARALRIDVGAFDRAATGTFVQARGGSPLAAVVAFDPQGRVDLVAEGRYEIGSSRLPRVDARLGVARGSLVLPWVGAGGGRRVEDVDITAEVSFAPTADDPMGRAAWSARGSVEAQWQGLGLDAGFRMGRFAPAGLVFDAWADLPDAPLGDPLLELAGSDRGILEVETMLRPRGSADVSLGVRLAEAAAARGGESLDRLLERFVSIRPRGNASLAWYGAIDPRRGVQEFGFPLPVAGVDGDVTWSIRPGPDVAYEGQLAFYDARAMHAGGPVDVQGSLHFVPRWKFGSPELAQLVPMPFHLVVRSTGLTVDDGFRRAMEGLYDAPELARILPTWNPEGGRVDFDLELWRTTDRKEMSMALDLRLADLAARWEELAVPASGVSGTVTVRTDGGGPERGRSQVRLDLEARTSAAARPLRVRGRVAGEGRGRDMAWFDVEVDGLNPRSAELRRELGRKNPDALDALEEAGVAEFLDARITAVRPIPAREARALRATTGPAGPFAYAGGMETWLDAGPGSERTGLRVQPRRFGVVTREAHGRLRLATALPPEPVPAPGMEPEEGLPVLPRTHLGARIQGLWRQTGPSVPVVARLVAAAGAPARFEALGAGLDIANDGLIGALITAAREASSASGATADPVDTNAFDVAGRVDFAARFTLPEAPGEPLQETEFAVEARLDRLAVGGSQVLEDVSAHVRFVDATDQWVGEEVRGRLGRTPVTMREVSWSPTAEGSVFRTLLFAEGLPIDEEHLSFFLDPQTRRVVLEDLGARGVFDLDGALLELRRSDVGDVSVRLTGDLGVADAFVDLGVPVELARVDGLDLDLTHEGRGLRARARVEGAFGTVAGRRLEDADLGLTYVEPRLVIESLEGRFEGGTLRPIGGRTSPGANLFTIDLAPPFPFELSAELDDVDIGEFLRGVFDSDFANRGRMDLDLRLAGNFEQLTRLEGGGSIRVRDSALWAIPVFQALSSRLGIDTTVLFRTMLCDYTIADGTLRMERMRVDSDLLSLVGEGSIDFEGDVTTDLQVRYGLVDRLGPFTQLLYHIQNSLLRVSVRGTMERPTVVLRGLVSQLFAPAEERDRLPLPGFGPRRRRF